MMTKTSKTKTENLITKKELNQVFWRSFQMEFSWNYERQMNMACCNGRRKCSGRKF